MQKYLLIGVSVAVALYGCANTPKGHTSYYFPKAETQISITQTLSCNAAGDTLHQVVTVTPTTAYSSDLGVNPYEFTPSSLDGTFSDTDIGLTFTDDGRLSGLNVTSTGQGGTIVKDALSVAAAAGLVAAAAPGALYVPKDACKIIAAYSGKAPSGKPAADDKEKKEAAAASDLPTLTLSYLGTFQYARTDDGNNLDSVKLAISVNGVTQGSPAGVSPDPASASLYTSLLHVIPNLPFFVEIEPNSLKYKAARWAGESKADILLKLNSVASATLTVKGPIGNLQKSGVVWQGHVPVPLTKFDKDFFWLPVPKARFFGTQKFTLALSNYGSIDKVEYSTTGASDAADGVSAMASAFKKPTMATQASDIQSKADLIYEQQRLAVCEADATKCASK